MRHIYPTEHGFQFVVTCDMPGCDVVHETHHRDAHYRFEDELTAAGWQIGVSVPVVEKYTKEIDGVHDSAVWGERFRPAVTGDRCPNVEADDTRAAGIERELEKVEHVKETHKS